MRLRSPPCWAKPSTFSDSTGNTQGIRFRRAPPRKAKASTPSQGRSAPLSTGTDAGGAADAGAAAAAPGVGQGPAIAKLMGMPGAWWPAVITASMDAGLSLRWLDNGARSTSCPSFHSCASGAG